MTCSDQKPTTTRNALWRYFVRGKHGFFVSQQHISYMNNGSAAAGMGDRLATIDMVRKVGGALWPKSGGCPLLCPFCRGAGSPSNIMLPGPRPTSVPSGILIHPTVWPQYTNVTDRQTDRQTGQRSRSIGRTVTCSGRQKIY